MQWISQVRTLMEIDKGREPQGHLPHDRKKGDPCIRGRKFWWGFPCICEVDSPWNLIKPRRGPEFILAPLNLMANWCKEYKKHLTLSGKVKWDIRWAGGQTNAFKATAGGFERFDPSDKKWEDDFWCCEDTDRPDLSEEIRVIITTMEKFASKGWQAGKKDADGVHRVIIDEAHVATDTNSSRVQAVKRLDPRNTMKWFLTGTPFEQSPRKMMAWADCLNWVQWGAWDTRYTTVYGYTKAEYNRHKEQDRRTLAMVERLAPGHGWSREYINRSYICQDLHREHLCVSTEAAKTLKGQERTRNYAKMLSNFLATLSVTLHKTTLFLGRPCGDMKPKLSVDVQCWLPKNYSDTINTKTQAALNELQIKYRRNADKKRGKANATADDKLIDFSKWSNSSHVVRVYSTWPPLMTMLPNADATPRRWVIEDIVKGGWLVYDRDDKAYGLIPQRSVIESSIANICKESVNPKWKALKWLYDNIWTKDDKVIIFCYAPMTAFILYWVRIVRMVGFECLNMY